MPEDIDRRLTVLEAQSKERWDSHDKRGQELKEDMKADFTIVFNKLDNVMEKILGLPCDGHHQRIKANGKIIWGVIIASGLVVLGVVTRIISTHFYNMTMRIP